MTSQADAFKVPDLKVASASMVPLDFATLGMLLDTPAPGVLSLISARTDHELLRAWLSRPEISPATARANAKEVSRFARWCQLQAKGFKDLRVEDFTAYSAFLLDPQPEEQWVSVTRWPRSDPKWRPFTGPLSPTSHRQTITILKGLFKWATDAHYLQANPASLLGKVRIPLQKTVERYIPVEGIDALFDACQALPENSRQRTLQKARGTFLMHLLYTTGARLNEVVTANMASFARDNGGRWWFHVIGKGNKAGKMPVAQELLEHFLSYRSAFGLHGYPPPNDPTPLILTTWASRKRASTDAVFNIVKQIAAVAESAAVEQGDEHLAFKLGQMSTHWMRHSCFSHQADSGMDLKTIQNNARHASIATTGMYLHKDDIARHAETLHAMKGTLAK